MVKTTFERLSNGAWKFKSKGLFVIILCILILCANFKLEFQFAQVRSLFTRKREPCSPYFEENRTKINTLPTPIEDIENEYPWVGNGGHWAPENCPSPTKVAIIIPFRKRLNQLLVLLRHIHPFLRKQLLDYTLIVVEQYGDGLFNKGRLMNAAFLESQKLRDFDCFIFHDADLLSEDYRNMYVCEEFPKHLSVAVNTMNYNLPVKPIFGGVTAFTKAQFEKVNGFSNQFWGWGGEDNEMHRRVVVHFGKFVEPAKTIGTFTMASHKKLRPNPVRYRVMKRLEAQFTNYTDGLGKVKYTVKSMALHKLYTWYLVQVGGNVTNGSANTLV